jgi:hypothetical protein
MVEIMMEGDGPAYATQFLASLNASRERRLEIDRARLRDGGRHFGNVEDD